MIPMKPVNNTMCEIRIWVMIIGGCALKFDQSLQAIITISAVQSTTKQHINKYYISGSLVDLKASRRKQIKYNMMFLLTIALNLQVMWLHLKDDTLKRLRERRLYTESYIYVPETPNFISVSNSLSLWIAVILDTKQFIKNRNTNVLSRVAVWLILLYKRKF